MEPKNVKRSRRKYDAAFKNDVLKMVESGRSVTDVADSLGVSSHLIHGWRKAAGRAMSVPSAGQSLVFDPEKLALQKKLREVEMERDILKKRA